MLITNPRTSASALLGAECGEVICHVVRELSLPIRGHAVLNECFDTAKPSAMWKRVTRGNAFDDCLGYAVSGIGAGLGDVVTDGV